MDYEPEIRTAYEDIRLSETVELSTMRVIPNDSLGVLVVYELDKGDAAVLVFRSASSRREMTSFPSNWRDLSDEDLLLLSDRARAD